MIIQQKRLERQRGFSIQVQLETIAILVTRRDRDDHGVTPGHTGFANDGQFVELIEFLRIQRTGWRITRVAKACDKGAADTLGPAIQPHDFLGRTIELQKPLTDLTLLDTMPDVMGRKTAVTFVDERALKALLLLCTPKSSQPVLGFIGVGGEIGRASCSERG